MKKLYAIGDIHGCLGPLKRLLAKISPDPVRDRVIFLGDYVNRGPESRQVLSELIEFKKRFPRTIFLQGNHEEMLLRYLHGRDDFPFLQVGGLATLRSYGVMEPDVAQAVAAIPESHRQFLLGLLPCWEEDGYVFVHAGIEQGRHLAMQSPEWLYWADRDRFLTQEFSGVQGVVFGHFVHEHPLVQGNKLGIDGGAVYGGHLICLVLPDREFVMVDSPVYWPPAGS